MNKDILRIIENEIVNNPSLEEMTTLLSEKGFQEQDIEDALTHFTDKFSGTMSDKVKRNIRLFSTKEVLDRVGYGFATHQYVNILFYLTCQWAGLGGVALLIKGILKRF